MPRESAAPNDKPVAIVGAGSWGTALAIQFARAGRQTRLWVRDAARARAFAAARRNTVYLPDAVFPSELEIAGDLSDALAGQAEILLAVPSHALRATLETVRQVYPAPARLALATKGFEQGTALLPHEVVAQVFGPQIGVAVLSGPTFAREVAQGLPTALVVAANDAEFAASVALSISSENFRAYTSTDLVGVEVGGGAKNALAIGAGMSDGLKFGANSRVALITRGLTEITRLGVALGARPETFMGLAGIGDLVLTCTDDQSRNRRMGLALAAGSSVAEAQREIGQVVEGLHAARAVYELAARLGVEMPIVEQIYRVVYTGASPRSAVDALMGRSIKAENGERLTAPGNSQ